jgi:hypothetical protein
MLPGLQTAKKLAKKARAYRLQAPPPGIDPDVIDGLWKYESCLPDLVDRLARRALQSDDQGLLIAYVAGAAVRHATFEAETRHWHEKQGLPASQGDRLQYLRAETLGRELLRLPSWRWRVLHSPKDAPRFMITDRVWIYVNDPHWCRAIQR